MANAATERRRSSAIDPSATKAAQAHSGYHGDNLAPIQSRQDEDTISSTGESSHHGAVNGAHGHNAGHTNFYDEATKSAGTNGGVRSSYDADLAPDQRA